MIPAACLTVLALLGATAVPQAGQAASDQNLVLKGRVTFERAEDKQTISFYVHGSSEVVSLRLWTKFTDQPSTASAAIYRTLLPGGTVTARFFAYDALPADVRRNLSNLLMCEAQPTKRTEKEVSFRLRCVTVDPASQVKDESGFSLFEMDGAVVTTNKSPLDGFITQGSVLPQKMILLRVER